MDAHPMKLGHHCHPLVIANQLGWTISTPCDVEVRWSGGWRADALKVRRGDPNVVVSTFGVGIVTWRIPYLFRTPPGWHLWVKGPANDPLDGAIPLEGVVESDHATAPFTMSWMLTRRGTVRWAQSAAICQLVPVPTKQLVDWELMVEEPQPDLRSAYQSWASERAERNRRSPYRPSLDYRRAAHVRRLRTR